MTHHHEPGGRGVHRLAGRKRCAVLSLSLLAMLEMSRALACDDSAVEVRISGDALHYRGELEADAVANVGELLRGAGGAISTLVIDSAGGDVNVGMDLAEQVLAFDLDVIVEGLCASSCANYVFPAGKRKQISTGAVVVWHGSALQEGVIEGLSIDNLIFEDGVEPSVSEKLALLERQREQAIRYLAEARARQRLFFSRVGVDARISVMGQQLRAAQEWTLSIKDMERFGIGNVVAAPDYGQCLLQSSAAPEQKQCSAAHLSGRGVELLRLDDYPEYAATLDPR